MESEKFIAGVKKPKLPKLGDCAQEQGSDAEPVVVQHKPIAEGQLRRINKLKVKFDEENMKGTAFEVEVLDETVADYVPKAALQKYRDAFVKLEKLITQADELTIAKVAGKVPFA